MTLKFHTADVFTDRMFGGNPLAVIPDARGLTDAVMAAITREFNYSETVFVLPPDDPRHTRRIRIFTPGSELPFAGHPTVGAAYVLAATGEITLDSDETRIVFEEGAGPVPVIIRSREGKPYFTQLTAPKVPARGPGSYDARTVADVISLSEDDLRLDHGFGIEAVSAGVPFLFVPLNSLDALSRARIKMDRWEAVLRDSYAPEVFLFTEVESRAEETDSTHEDGVFRARMFGPTLGVPEDPATGGACAALGGYLASRSKKLNGTLRFTVHQGVEMGRPSRIEVETDRSGGVVQRVRVGGASVLVSSGTLHLASE